MVSDGLSGPGRRQAKAWAAAVDAFRRESVQRAGQGSVAPLLILDLLPGNGQCAWTVVNALLDLHATGSNTPDGKPWFCYVACLPDPMAAESFSAHPLLQSLIGRGLLHLAIWEAEFGAAWLVEQQVRLTDWMAIRPVVVLTHDLPARLAQPIFGVHYGNLLAGAVPVDGSPLVTWEPAGGLTDETVERRVLDAYLAAFNSAVFTIPTGAIHLLQRIFALSPSGVLWLGHCAGLATQTDLRLACSEGRSLQAATAGTLPTNLDALLRGCAAPNVESWHADTREAAIQYAMGRLPGAQRHWLDQVVAPLRDAAPEDTDVLTKVACQLALRRSLPALLPLLRLSDFEPALFSAIYPTIALQAQQAQGNSRQAWRLALTRVWGNHFPTRHSASAQRELAQVAMALGAWGLAIAILRQGIQVQGPNATDFAQLAWCLARTGHTRLGCRLARRAVAMAPDNDYAREAAERIAERLFHWDRQWRTRMGSTRGTVALEPLDASHAEEVLRQFRDPQIAIMTGLPAMRTLLEVRDWIAGHANDPHRIVYAILHAEHGLVGVLGLSVAGRDGYLYFWIGAEHQGQGHAREAVRLLCRHARRQQIDYVFTSTFADNVRSQRVLAGHGFQNLSISALPPHQNVVFHFLCDQEKDARGRNGRLARLCRWLDSSFEFDGMAWMESRRPDAARNQAGEHVTQSKSDQVPH